VSRFLGVPILRKEDPALLSGAGRYADDLPVPAGTLHAHVIRSPHAHAKIVGIDATEALAQDGIWAVVTGEDVRALSDPFLIALKAPVHQWSLAVERVRYVGEPVAFVVADTRYLAEDAADLVRIDYEPLEAVVDPLAACDKSAPCCMRKPRPTRFRSASFPTAMPSARSSRPMPVLRSPANIRATRSRRWNATSSSPSTGRARAATTCWRTFRARSAPIR
jgi:Aerobic-type carbon monoxide dehydrogenase, large subunit CoxL/CutL homologs